MRYKFNDIAINSVEKRKPTENDRLLYIGLEHLETNELRVQQFGSIVPIIGEKLVMYKGDVLFGRRNTYLKRAAIAPHDGLFSAHGMVLRPQEQVIAKEFFPFFISSDYFFEAAIRISVGSLSPTVNWGALKDLEFNLPTLEEQKALARVLWAIVEAKNAYKALIEQTEQLVKSQFIELFGDVFLGTEKYKKQTINTLISENIAKVGRAHRQSDVIKYIDISSIDNTNGEITQYKDFCVEKAPSRAQQVVKQGDILVSTVRPNLKNVAIVKDGYGNLVASTGFCVLRPSKKINAEYLFAIINTKEFAEYLSHRAKGASYPAVNGSDIKSFEVQVPPMDMQNYFAQIVRQADKSKFHLRNQMVNTLKNSLNMV